MTTKLSLFILFDAVIASNAFVLSTSDQSLHTFNRNKLQISPPPSTITTPTHARLKSAIVASNVIDTPRDSLSIPNSVQTVSVSTIIGAMTAMILLIAKHGLMTINKRFFSKYPLPTLVASGALLGGLVHFFDDNHGHHGHHSYTAPTFTSLADDDELLSKDDSNLVAKRLYLRLLALVVTIGSGFSMGIAGPAAEMGMVVACCLSSWLNINDVSSVLRMIVAGAAAGVGANFKAPLTGLLFAVEVTRRMIIVPSQPAANASPAQQQPQETLALTGAIVGALLVVNRGQLLMVASSSPLLPLAFSSLSSSSLSVTHALALIVLGCLTAAVHVSYDRLRRWLLNKDQPWQKRVDKRLRPFIAGLACGLAALYGYPQHLSSGFNQLTGLVMMMQPSHPPHLELRLALSFTAVRFLLVALCSATIGLVGGQFAPMVFLGGGVGAVFYHLLVAMSAIVAVGPISSSSGLIVLCGAAAMLGLQFKAIIMASIFIAEATGQMTLLIPALITAAVAMVSKAIITQEKGKR